MAVVDVVVAVEVMIVARWLNRKNVSEHVRCRGTEEGTMYQRAATTEKYAPKLQTLFSCPSNQC